MRSALARFGLLIFLAPLAGCQPPLQSGATGSAASLESQAASGVAHDLSQDEAQGGHTLKKHVGRSDDQLRERLRRERNISAASTYTDRATAERSIAAALQQNTSKLQKWLSREGGHPNLVLDYDSPQPIGRTMRRGADQAEPCSHSVVVLKWNGPNDYHVLTSYPECR